MFGDMFGDGFGKVTRQTPISVISGFGDLGDTEATVEGAITAVANTLLQYFRTTSPTTTPIVTQPAVQPSAVGGISSIWLIGGGIAAWYLFKKYKGKKEVI